MKNWFNSLHPNKFAAFCDGLLSGLAIAFFYRQIKKFDEN